MIRFRSRCRNLGKAFESVSMGLLPIPNWIDLDGDRIECEAIDWAWRLDKKDRDAQKEAQGGAGMKTLVQSCKITIGNKDAGHTVHFPDGCNEHVEARPFDDIDRVIERAVKQRKEWEEIMERSRFLEQNKDKKVWIANNLDVDNIIERAVKQREERDTHKADNPATPAYYRFHINGADCDVFDIARAAGLTPASTMALKYLLRAGKKDGAVDDLRKCIRCVEREIELGQGAA